MCGRTGKSQDPDLNPSYCKGWIRICFDFIRWILIPIRFETNTDPRNCFKSVLWIWNYFLWSRSWSYLVSHCVSGSYLAGRWIQIRIWIRLYRSFHIRIFIYGIKSYLLCRKLCLYLCIFLPRRLTLNDNFGSGSGQVDQGRDPKPTGQVITDPDKPLACTYLQDECTGTGTCTGQS